MFKGIIFDLDGTLVNSLEDLADSMNMVLQQYNFPSHEIQDYKQLTGKGIRNLVCNALPQGHHDNELINNCFDSMMDVYRKNCIQKTKPYDGILELLNELAVRKMKIAVFSNKADEFTKKIVMEVFSMWNFNEIVGLVDEADRKPNPKSAILISKKLGINPENMIYVGDTGIDMQTANNAGMYAVGALWGFRTKEELISNGAKSVIKNPIDLIQLL